RGRQSNIVGKAHVLRRSLGWLAPMDFLKLQQFQNLQNPGDKANAHSCFLVLYSPLVDAWSYRRGCWDCGCKTPLSHPPWKTTKILYLHPYFVAKAHQVQTGT